MFTTICKMSQPRLKKFVAKKLRETYDNVIVEDGFVYAQGDFPVLLVAHLDTVHATLPLEMIYDNTTDTLSSPQGIGGDDRCGVYMILNIIKKHKCSVLFCEDEEIGCVGADKFVNSDIAKDLQFNYIIEFDRRGKNDAVFYNCDNPEFENFITKTYYKTSWGSFSDISIIAPFLQCAAVNLSCGYYNAHTVSEYVVMAEMEESIKQACNILERTTANDKFEYIEATHFNYTFDKYDYDFYDEKEYWIEWYDAEQDQDQWVEVYGTSKAEAVGKFLMEHTSLSYDDIYVMTIHNNRIGGLQ